LNKRCQCSSWVASPIVLSREHSTIARAFDLRKRGAKGTRTPGLLHAIQIQPISGRRWKWPYQQLQSPHVARDGPLLPLACSPSCSHRLLVTGSECPTVRPGGPSTQDPRDRRDVRSRDRRFRDARRRTRRAAMICGGRPPPLRHRGYGPPGVVPRRSRPPRGQQARDGGSRAAPITAHACYGGDREALAPDGWTARNANFASAAGAGRQTRASTALTEVRIDCRRTRSVHDSRVAGAHGAAHYASGISAVGPSQRPLTSARSARQFRADAALVVPGAGG
jgi:hypothetical protein